MAIKEQVENLLEPYLEEGKYFVVDLRVQASRSGQKVMILLDSDEGITIQECADISRALGEDLEEADAGDNPYTLEVSSPGVDQPLKLTRQYRKNVGRTIKVVLTSGETMTGTLLEGKENSIVLQLPTPKKKSKVLIDEAMLKPEIPLETIAKAVVQVSFK